MEPMSCSPVGSSPGTNISPYLPAFLLMGEVPTTSRNALSPLSTRNLSYVNSPAPNTTPQELNRTKLTQKTLFGGVNSSTSLQNHTPNMSSSGPPTQGLFDTLRNEGHQIHTPVRTLNGQSFYETPTQQTHHNVSNFGLNQSNVNHSIQLPYNESYITNTSLNVTHGFTSPIGSNSLNASYMSECPPAPRYTEFWVTVYGFPPSATSIVLNHFAQCGTIVEKVFPPQNGNWVHLKFASRLECDKALNYNEKILANNIMIGVTQCTDREIVDKENMNVTDNNIKHCKIRPLAQTAYKTIQNEAAVVNNANVPQKNTGIVNKAMDLLFGW